MYKRQWEGTLKINKKVSDRLEAIRAKNLKIHSDRISEINKKIPRIAEIEELNKKIGFKLVKAVLKEGYTVSELESESKSLKKEKEELLESHGYSTDYLDPIYDCHLCKDTGVVMTEQCSCKKRMITEELYSISGIDKSIVNENFNTFDLGLFRANRNSSEMMSPKEAMKIYYDNAIFYAENFERLKKKNIIYYGPVGTGKTFLCNCIARELLDKGYLVVYQTATKLMNFISDYNFSRTDEKYRLKAEYDMLKNCDLLIIDDLGTEISTSINMSNLFEIINDRIISERATIISTNLDMEDIRNEYDDRIFSRILGSFDLYHVFGDDLRIKKFAEL